MENRYKCCSGIFPKIITSSRYTRPISKLSLRSPSMDVLSLLSDIYSAVDRSQLTLLALFDVSSAFDMVDHEILLQRLETSCGLKGSPLLWLRSYLSDRTQMIISGDSRTQWVPVKLGVPQGSVLGPSYSFYTRLVFLPFSQIIRLSAIFLLMMSRRMSMGPFCSTPSC